MRALALFATSILLSGCGPGGGRLEEAVKAELRDPESAQFGDVHKCGRSEVYTGQVNSKNAFGGYAGATPFVYADGEAAVLGGDDVKFSRIMQVCNAAWKVAAQPKP